MNKQRRKELSSLCDRVEALKSRIEELKTLRDDLVSDIESVRNDEQGAYDNLPESLQQGEQGQDMEAAISSMEEATGALEGIDLDIDLDDVVRSLDDARGA